MNDKLDPPHWPSLLQPLAEASTALGRLTLALETMPLHQAWLWREMARSAAKISQIGGYRIASGRLCQALAGLPFEPAEDDPGLAAARRVFLVAAPLFRRIDDVDSSYNDHELFQPLWADHRPEENLFSASDDRSGHAGEAVVSDQLQALVRDLAGTARSGNHPPLINLLLGLHGHAMRRRLPPSLARLALPLALHRTGLAPKAAPGLLGGRLPFTTAGHATAAGRADGGGVTAWLARALHALAKEAEAACARLVELNHQHRIWHGLLHEAGPRGHSRAPAVLDLLAITPVLSTSLVARHVGCTPQGAGVILHQLVNLGLLVQATRRARWKIFVANDLAPSNRGGRTKKAPLSPGERLPPVDLDAIEETLNKLFADLEHASTRVRERTRVGRLILSDAAGDDIKNI